MAQNEKYDIDDIVKDAKKDKSKKRDKKEKRTKLPKWLPETISGAEEDKKEEDSFSTINASKQEEEEKKVTPPEAKKEAEDDEISLLDLLAVVLKYFKMIVAITGSVAVFMVVVCVISLVLPADKSFMPNVYTSSANMLINNTQSGSGGLADLMGGAAGGIGRLMGIGGGGGGSFTELALYLASSSPLFDAAIKKFRILEREEFKESKAPLTAGRKYMSSKIKVSSDEKNGVFTVSATDKDKEFAQSLVNFCVDWLSNRFDELGVDKNKIKKDNLEKNIDLSYKEIQRLQDEVNNLALRLSQNGVNIPAITLETTKLQMELDAQTEVYKQLKIQYELLKVEMASDTPVFQILERPELPEIKSGPSRGMYCIIATFAAGFLSLFLAFVLNAVKNVRQDKEAMGKLFGKKE